MVPWCSQGVYAISGSQVGHIGVTSHSGSSIQPDSVSCQPLYLTATLRNKLRPVFCQAQGVSHGQRHDVHVAHMP